MGSFIKIGSVDLLGFPGPAKFSASTRNLYFFLLVRPFTLEQGQGNMVRSVYYIEKRLICLNSENQFVNLAEYTST